MSTTGVLSDTFRANVRAGLRMRDMTQAALAREMRVSHHLVSKLLTNPRGGGISLATVERVADALDIPVSVMLTPGGVQRSRTARVTKAT